MNKPAYLSRDYQRMWDLVRQQRSELLEADLITREEYAQLAADETIDKPGQGSPSPRRLESYDELRAALHAMREALHGFIEDSLDEHGDEHHEDDCPRCELIIKARAALALWEAK